MKILWFSRHQPLPSQRTELEAYFPGYQLIVDSKTFDGASDIVTRLESAGADEIVVVAPLSVVRALTKRGLRPIWAEMKNVPAAEAEVTLQTRAGPRHYRFIKFWRIAGVKLDLIPVAPVKGKNNGDKSRELTNMTTSPATATTSAGPQVQVDSKGLEPASKPEQAIPLPKPLL